MQGAFDSEVVKVLAFYRVKTVELDSKLSELQADIAAIPAQAAQDDDVAVEEQLALISALHSRLQVHHNALNPPQTQTPTPEGQASNP